MSDDVVVERSGRKEGVCQKLRLHLLRSLREFEERATLEIMRLTSLGRLPRPCTIWKPLFPHALVKLLPFLSSRSQGIPHEPCDLDSWLKDRQIRLAPLRMLVW